MALKPISLNLLEDTFVCQGRYASDDIRYADYLDEKKQKQPMIKVSPKLVKTIAQPNARAEA